MTCDGDNGDGDNSDGIVNNIVGNDSNDVVNPPDSVLNSRASSVVDVKDINQL